MPYNLNQFPQNGYSSHFLQAGMEFSEEGGSSTMKHSPSCGHIYPHSSNVSPGIRTSNQFSSSGGLWNGNFSNQMWVSPSKILPTSLHCFSNPYGNSFQSDIRYSGSLTEASSSSRSQNNPSQNPEPSCSIPQSWGFSSGLSPIASCTTATVSSLTCWYTPQVIPTTPPFSNESPPSPSSTSSSPSDEWEVAASFILAQRGQTPKIHKKCNCIKCQYSQNAKKEYVCHFKHCHKSYSKTSHLKAHLRTHLGSRPFVCDHDNCSKAFTRSDELSRHKRTHTGERNYSCDTCYKRFLRSDHLAKHKKTHLKEMSKLI